MAEAAGLSYSIHRGGGSEQEHPPLILIHGAGGSRLDWPPELRRLDGEWVYGLDLPGHGRSQGEGEQAVDRYVERASNWMEAVSLERAVLVGHSMGGAIALKMALDRPTRVEGLVLVGTGGRLRVNRKIIELTSKHETFSRAVDQIIAWAFSPSASPRLVELACTRMVETRPEVLHGDLLACNRFDVLDRLGEIKVPTQVICGADDMLTPLKYSRFLVEAIPEASLVAIDGAGHMVMLERPGDVARVVKEFMDQCYG